MDVLLSVWRLPLRKAAGRVARTVRRMPVAIAHPGAHVSNDHQLRNTVLLLPSPGLAAHDFL